MDDAGGDGAEVDADLPRVKIGWVVPGAQTVQPVGVRHFAVFMLA